MAWLYKQRGSDNWWLGYRLNGKQILRSTGTDDREQAERELAKLEAVKQAHKAGSLTEEFFRLLTNKAASAHTLRDYANQWLKECRDLSPVTQEKYRDTIDEFCTFVGNYALPLRDVSRDTVRGYLRQKRDKTSAATTKACRRIVCAFFNYAVDNEAIQQSPVPSSKSLKLNDDKKSERRAFTMKELKDVYDSCPDDFWRYMVIGGFYTALRMGDLITLPWGAVDFAQNVIRLKTRKTGQQMHIPIRAELRAILLKRKKDAGEVKPADYVWPEQAEKYERLGAGPFSNEFYDTVLLKAGLVTKRAKHAARDEHGNKILKQGRTVNEISFHCLRHTFVSLVKLTGGSQAVAKELAGHSTDAVSDLYTHVPEAVLSDAIKQLPAVAA